jgi:hypothetical protein
MTIDANRKAVKMHIPQRISWWLSSIDDDLSDQTLNRQIGCGVDETHTMDAAVAQHQLNKAVTGERGFEETDNVLICREIFRLVAGEFLTVAIPFADSIIWRDVKNRRNLPIFLDLVKAYAVMRFMQREKRDDQTIVAELKDFNDAVTLYRNRAETQTTKLNALELKIVRTIHSYPGEIDSKTIQIAVGLAQARVYQLIHGQTGRTTGLLGKLKGLHCEHRRVADSDNKEVWKNMYSITGYNLLDSYGDVVGLADDVWGANSTGFEHVRAEVIDVDAPASDIPIGEMMKDAHAWWFNYFGDSGGSAYVPANYLDYLAQKEPKYNTKARRDSLLWILANKKDGVEGWG